MDSYRQVYYGLKYIKGAILMGIRYKANNKERKLLIYTDADYASDSVSRRSVSGMVTKYCGGAITWMSKRQQCVPFFNGI